MMEHELAEVRGQLAQAQLPPPPSPGSTGVGPGGEKQRMALREQCTALDARLQEVCLLGGCTRFEACLQAELVRTGVSLQAKQDAENLRAQLKDEQAKQKQAQQALVNEQQYFMNKLADMEAITKGVHSSVHVLCTVSTQEIQCPWQVSAAMVRVTVVVYVQVRPLAHQEGSCTARFRA